MMSAPKPAILLVEDCPDLRQLIREELEDAGYDVEAAADGQEALDCIRCRRPALVISDMMMPRLDGPGLLRAVRADASLRAIPFIFLSALQEEVGARRLDDRRGVTICGKPIDFDALVETLSRTLTAVDGAEDAHDAGSGAY